jgi:hypothetical protein
MPGAPRQRREPGADSAPGNARRLDSSEAVANYRSSSRIDELDVEGIRQVLASLPSITASCSAFPIGRRHGCRHPFTATPSQSATLRASATPASWDINSTLWTRRRCCCARPSVRMRATLCLVVACPRQRAGRFADSRFEALWRSARSSATSPTIASAGDDRDGERRTGLFSASVSAPSVGAICPTRGAGQIPDALISCRYPQLPSRIRPARTADAAPSVWP